MIEELVVSLQLENKQLIVMMIMEHILSFQYKTHWKKYDLKNVLKKEIFWQKSLTHCVNLCTTILMVGHPSAPVIPKTRHLWSTKWLSNHLPGRLCAVSNTTRAVRLTKCRFKLPSPNLPSSGLGEFYVRQVVCVCFYSLCKNMYYNCNVEYTARCACPASRLAPTLPGQ